MKQVKTLVLEDGIEYFVIDEIEYKGDTYYYFANMNDEKDVCVRKKLIENNEEYITMLDSVEELQEVLAIFAEKYKNLLTKEQ